MFFILFSFHWLFLELPYVFCMTIKTPSTCRWSLIASRIAGRTDNQIKNVWYSRLCKRVAKREIQRSNILKPVPYRYKSYPKNEDYMTVTANPEAVSEQILYMFFFDGGGKI